MADPRVRVHYKGLAISLLDGLLAYHLDKLGLVLKLRMSSIGLAGPRVPASPREASPRVQKVGLLPSLVEMLFNRLQSNPPGFIAISMHSVSWNSHIK